MRTQYSIARECCAGRRQVGFTMIEILMAVAIAAILAMVAVPSLTGFTRNNKLNAINTSLVASLQQGRSEAIKLNRGVLVCPANTTHNDCNATTDWGINGWLVCYDVNNNMGCDASTTALPNPIKVENKVDATFAAVTGPSTPIRFGPSGSLSTGVSAAALSITGTWSGATAMGVTVATTGLIKGTRL